MTNRELYQAICGTAQGYKSSERTLEQYLSALLILVRRHSNLDSLPVSDFVQVLSDAFTAEPLPFDEGWRTQYTSPDEDVPGFAGSEAMLIRQVVDLHEMDEVKTLENELRYFGLRAPRKSYWYNFDPVTFLECGISGTFGGWEEDDPTGRVLVDGLVGVIDADGQVVGVDPKDIESPVTEVSDVSWEQFRDFLWCGQNYE